MSIKAICKLAAIGALAFAASTSQAALEDSWNYKLELSWVPGTAVFDNVDKLGNPINTPGYPGGYTAEKYLLSWGAANGKYKGLGVDPNGGANRSALEITTPIVSGKIDTNGSTVEANLFTHYNNPIWNVYPSLQKVDLSVSITLTSLDGFAKHEFSRVFEVFFIETENNGKKCSWTTSGLCDDDIFAIVSMAPTLDNFTNTFTLDGYEYTLNYFETTDFLNPLSVAACEAAGIKGRACYGFTTPESMATAVQFGFSITAVPEPETYAMLLAGLGMVGTVVRRRRNAIHN